MFTFIQNNTQNAETIEKCLAIYNYDSCVDANWTSELSVFDDFFYGENGNKESLFEAFVEKGAEHFLKPFNVSEPSFTAARSKHFLFNYSNGSDSCHFSFEQKFDDSKIYFYFNFFLDFKQDYEKFFFTPNNKEYLSCVKPIYNILYNAYFNFLNDHANGFDGMDEDGLSSNPLYIDFKTNRDFSKIVKTYDESRLIYNESEQCAYWKSPL